MDRLGRQVIYFFEYYMVVEIIIENIESLHNL